MCMEMEKKRMGTFLFLLHKLCNFFPASLHPRFNKLELHLCLLYITCSLKLPDSCIFNSFGSLRFPDLYLLYLVEVSQTPWQPLWLGLLHNSQYQGVSLFGISAAVIPRHCVWNHLVHVPHWIYMGINTLKPINKMFRKLVMHESTQNYVTLMLFLTLSLTQTASSVVWGRSLFPQKEQYSSFETKKKTKQYESIIF